MAKTKLVDPIPEYLKPDLLSTDEALQLVEYHKANPDPDTGKPKTTTYLGVPIRQEHSIRVMARKIIKHNLRRQFTSISNIGMSGAGKTSSTTNLVHEIHSLGESEFGIIYSIRWVGREELIHFDKFLKSLVPVPTILIFEDISYALDFVKKQEKIKIKEAFTHIRHTMGEVNVIVVFHYHYTRGMDKMMRASKFSLITSINNEERGNLMQIYGSDNKEFFDKLEWRLRGMDEQGWCTVDLDDETGKKYVYYFGKPFSIALSDQNGKLHFVFYGNYKTSDKVWCNLCSPFPIGAKLDPRELVEEVTKKYGRDAALSVGKWISFIRGGNKSIHSKLYQTWKLYTFLLARNPLDMEDFHEYLSGLRKIDKKNPHAASKSQMQKIESNVVRSSVIKNKPTGDDLQSEVLAGFENMNQNHFNNITESTLDTEFSNNLDGGKDDPEYQDDGTDDFDDNPDTDFDASIDKTDITIDENEDTEP